MAEEMIEDIDWESDEAEDWESDEAIAEAEDSEDIGERVRRRRRQGRARRAYWPTTGVRGMAVRGQDGRVRNVPFPTKLATTAETNRGLASQEVARRALDARVDRLEARFRGQQKNDSAVSGVVSLGLIGGLAAYGAIQAGRQGGGFSLGNWASETSTRGATVASGVQLATSGAKLVINGRYHRSGIGIAADIVAAAQIALFAFGSFYTPEEYQPVADKAAAEAAMAAVARGTLFLTQDRGEVWRVEINGANGARALRLIR